MKKPIPLFTLLLVLANLLAYGAELAGGGLRVCDALGLVPARFVRTGDAIHVITSLFLHDPGSLWHLGGNMVFLAVFGALVERSVGHLRFLVLYLAAGVVGGLLHVLVNPAATDPLVGASGAIFGVLAVAAVLRPRLLGFVVSFTALNVWYAWTGSGGNVSFGTHLGGFAIGFFFVVVLSRASNVFMVARRERRTS